MFFDLETTALVSVSPGKLSGCFCVPQHLQIRHTLGVMTRGDVSVAIHSPIRYKGQTRQIGNHISASECIVNQPQLFRHSNRLPV